MPKSVMMLTTLASVFLCRQSPGMQASADNVSVLEHRHFSQRALFVVHRSLASQANIMGGVIVVSGQLVGLDHVGECVGRIAPSVDPPPGLPDQICALGMVNENFPAT
jgi:hypothetical protein